MFLFLESVDNCHFCDFFFIYLTFIQSSPIDLIWLNFILEYINYKWWKMYKSKMPKLYFVSGPVWDRSECWWCRRCEVWSVSSTGGVEAWCEVWRVGDWSCSHGLSPGTNIQTPGDSRGHHRTPPDTRRHQETPVETRIITRQASSSNTDWPHAGIPSIKKTTVLSGSVKW